MFKKSCCSPFVLALSFFAASFALGCTTSEVDDGGDKSVSAQTADAITLQNWEDHPKLKEIFALRSEVTIAEHEQLWERATKHNACPDSSEEWRTMLTDDDGHIRSLAIRADTNDGYNILHAIYDAAGKLRYVESSVRTARNTGEDHLVFLDSQGARLWEVIQPWTPDHEGEGRPADWRTPRPPTEDEFDTFAFGDPHFVDDPTRVFTREPHCD